MAQSSSQLPVEIWRRILKHATHVPGELETIHNSFTNTTVTAVHKSQGAIVATYELRRTIVLVCRLWNEVGTPILYQSIVIRELERTIPSLNAALEPITRRNTIPFASPSFIRRLDINLYPEEWRRMFMDQRNGFNDLEFLLSLLKESSMLCIFRIDFPIPITVFTHLDRFFKKLYECLPLSLKTLMIHLLYYIEPERIDENWTFSVNLPHHSLDTITIWTQLPIAVFNIGNVRNLEISQFVQLPNHSRIDVPSALTTLRILDLDLPDGLECLKELGKHIETLETWEPEEEHDLPMHLEAIARYCPRLATLVVRGQAGLFEVMRPSSFPALGIRRLGYKLRWQPSNEDVPWDRMFNNLKDVCRPNSLPNLKEFFFCWPYKRWATQKDLMIYLQSQASSLHKVTGVKTFYEDETDGSMVPFCSF